MGVGPARKAVTTIPYNTEKDIEHYDLKGSYYVADPGTYFIFFPQDVHRPGIRIDSGDVRKIVVKIRAAP
jgi:YhcH/YjgK/YiaL family protein